MLGIASMLSVLPDTFLVGPLGMLRDVKRQLESAGPILSMVQADQDPATYLRQVPRERMESVIDQMISRLEWVKYGEDSRQSDGGQVGDEDPQQ
ncbi:hypothetical protein SD51_12140 [Alicyclobacillus tengchongensis]|nr:hypothetical protein SD51_12140 [Alicyclobacillus tengchongensis]